MKTLKSKLRKTSKFLLVALSICFFSNMVAKSQTDEGAKNKVMMNNPSDLEGSWNATIKEDSKIHIEFHRDNSINSSNSSDFLISELSAMPKEKNGEFKLTREAGTVVFNGKFEGNEGSGRYKFIPDNEFRQHMINHGIKLDDREQFAFFHVNVTKAYLKYFQDNRYDVTANDLIPLAALKVDEAYIRFWNENGYKNMKTSDLIPMKALNITPDYVKQFRSLGYNDIAASNLIPMKSLGITPEYVKSFQDIGFKNVSISKFIPLKSLGVTADYVKRFQDIGYNNIELDEMISLKATGVTPEYVKQMKAKDLNTRV